MQISQNVGRVRCEKGWNLAPAWSERLHDFDLWYVWAGSGSMHTPTGDVRLRPGICFWMRPGGVYIAEQDDADRLGVTFIHFDLIDKTGTRFSQKLHKTLPPESFEVPDSLFFDAITRRVVQLLESDLERTANERADAKHTAHLLLTSLLRDIDATSSHRNLIHNEIAWQKHKRVTNAALQMSENLQEVPVISTLAEQMGYSVDHFTRIFKHVFGLSPQAFVIQARINRARQLLIESSLSVTQIAELTGYQDVYFFSRQFKAKTGVSPKQFRHGNL